MYAETRYALDVEGSGTGVCQGLRDQVLDEDIDSLEVVIIGRADVTERRGSCHVRVATREGETVREPPRCVLSQMLVEWWACVAG